MNSYRHRLAPWAALLIAAICVGCQQSTDARAIEMSVTVRSAHSQSVKAPLSGMVTAVHVREDQLVQSGQLIAELDVAGLQMRLLQHRTTLSRLQTQYDLMRTQNNPKGADICRAQLEDCRDKVRKLEKTIATGKIRAPAAGRILGLDVDLGSRVRTGQALCAVVEPEQIIARGTLAASQADALTPDATGQVVLVSNPDMRHQARVVRIEPLPVDLAADDEGQPAPEPRKRVTLLISGSATNLRPGMSGVARLQAP
jgi:multidrug resistance efflux pump